MMRRLLVAITFAAVGLSPAPANAQTMMPGDFPVVHRLDLSGALVNTGVSSVLLDADQLPSLQRPSFTPRPSEKRTSGLMMSLYASTAAVQALDVHSTLSALNRGAVEKNPFMKGIAGNTGAFIAMKAGIAAGTIFATHQAAKRNKVAAIITTFAINSAYLFVISHNYRVARGSQ
jgi:hypothetical protein